MLEPLSPTPDLTERVHAALLDSICTGEFAPGRRLTQAELARQLAVSRQPVIQALNLLRRQGLVLDTPSRRGVVVAPMDADAIRDLYAVRASLDALAAQEAARRAPADALAGLDALIGSHESFRATDLGRLVDDDVEFHATIYRASGNDLLERTARQHAHHTRRAMSIYLRDPDGAAAAWHDHRRILEAIRAQDGDLASRLAREHAQRSCQALLAQTRDDDR
ncbi:MAG: GntR family transcriptional regulator [Burkholderiaceae bacterium]